MGVGSVAAADQLGERLDSTLEGMTAFLHYQERGSFTQAHSLAMGVERPTARGIHGQE
jgi:hypothetical protein